MERLTQKQQKVLEFIEERLKENNPPSQREIVERLTQKQQKVLEFIEERLKENNPPSQREIAGYFGLSQNAVYQLITYLRKKGYLVNCGGHRGIRLSGRYLEKTRRTDGLPLVGTVAAGDPVLAEENIEEYVDLPDMFGGAKSAFLLRVTGDSMVDEGIMDGDLVVVKPASTIENGRIGVVLLDDEATVKRVYIQRGRVALKPANRAAGYQTRYVKRGSQSLRIIGRVIGCLRTLS